MSTSGAGSRVFRTARNQYLPCRDCYHCPPLPPSTNDSSVPIPRSRRRRVRRASTKPRTQQPDARLGRNCLSGICSFQLGWREHPTCNSSPRDEHSFNLLANDDSASRHDLSALSLLFPRKRGRPSLLASFHSYYCSLGARGCPEHFRIAKRILQARQYQKWTSLVSHERSTSIDRERRDCSGFASTLCARRRLGGISVKGKRVVVKDWKTSSRS